MHSDFLCNMNSLVTATSVAGSNVYEDYFTRHRLSSAYVSYIIHCDADEKF